MREVVELIGALVGSGIGFAWQGFSVTMGVTTAVALWVGFLALVGLV